MHTKSGLVNYFIDSQKMAEGGQKQLAKHCVIKLFFVYNVDVINLFSVLENHNNDYTQQRETKNCTCSGDLISCS